MKSGAVFFSNQVDFMFHVLIIMTTVMSVPTCPSPRRISVVYYMQFFSDPPFASRIIVYDITDFVSATADQTGDVTT